MKISTMIKQLLRPKGQLTQRQLADKLKVTERSIYNWLHDNGEPSYSKGKKLERMNEEVRKR